MICITCHINNISNSNETIRPWSTKNDKEKLVPWDNSARGLRPWAL